MSRSIRGIASRSSKREADLPVDVAVDRQRPAVDVDDRQREPGVDAVEVVGRGPERRDAGDPVVEPARERRRGGLRPRGGRCSDGRRGSGRSSGRRTRSPPRRPRQLPLPRRTARRLASVPAGAPARARAVIGAGETGKRRRRPTTAVTMPGSGVELGCTIGPAQRGVRARPRRGRRAGPRRGGTTAGPAARRPPPAQDARRAPTRPGPSCRWCRSGRSPTP